MKWTRLACIVGCLAWFAAAASAQSPEPEPPVALGGSHPPFFGGPTWQPTPNCPAPPSAMPPDGATPPTMPPDGTTPPTTPPNPAPAQAPGEAFGLASEAGTQAAPSVAPNMFGDLLGAGSGATPVVATIPGQGHVFFPPGSNPNTILPAGTVFNVPTLNPNGTIRPAGQPLTAAQPLGAISANAAASLPGSAALALIARGAFKIAENESPRPQDRVFAEYNYFDNAIGSDLRQFGIGQTNVNREVIGFEKTFLDGNASIGMRQPFFQSNGDPIVKEADVGDLDIVFKYAFLNDRQTGNVLSAGMVLTLPTGAELLPIGSPNIHPTLFQPYVGWIYNAGDLYAQGFTSLTVPTDDRDVTILFNDFGVGYYLYRNKCQDSWLTAVTPTVELHITTPLDHRGSQAQPIGLPDIVDMTFGTTIGFGARTTLMTGVVAPLTGPKPFDVEALVYLNYRF